MIDQQTFARVVLASKPDNGVAPIVTIHARYPRIIHGEVMTHRAFERNARSSRAVPVMTMLKEVWHKPFIPSYFGKNKRGMQAGDELTGFKRWVARTAWLISSKLACVAAYVMLKAGLHKQIANRVLEPYSYIDTLITSTEWDNFKELRVHADAEPHFRDLAVMIMELVYDPESYVPIKEGEWHLPYVTPCERKLLPSATLLKLSTARCARISYAPFNGKSDIKSETERYSLLVESKPIHASPAGHQARLLKSKGMNGNLADGWTQHRKIIEYAAKA